MLSRFKSRTFYATVTRARPDGRCGLYATRDVTASRMCSERFPKVASRHEQFNCNRGLPALAYVHTPITANQQPAARRTPKQSNRQPSKHTRSAQHRLAKAHTDARKTPTWKAPLRLPLATRGSRHTLPPTILQQVSVPEGVHSSSFTDAHRRLRGRPRATRASRARTRRFPRAGVGVGCPRVHGYIHG